MSAHRRHHQRRGLNRRQLINTASSSEGAVTAGKTTSTPTSTTTERTTSTTSTTPTQQTSTTSESKPTTTNTPPPPPPTTQTTSTTSSTTQAALPTTTSNTAQTTSSTSSTTHNVQTTQQQTTPPVQNGNPSTAQRGTSTVFSTAHGGGLSSVSSASPTSTLDSSHSGDGGSGAGRVIATVAGVVGGIVAVCVIAGWIMRIWRKRQDRIEAEAAGNSFSASEFRKSGMMLSDSNSSRSPRPPSIIERRLNAAPVSMISTSGAYSQHSQGYGGGYGGYPSSYGHDQQGGYDRSSYHEYQPQQYQLPPQAYSPTAMDPFMASPVSHASSPMSHSTYSPGPSPLPQSPEAAVIATAASSGSMLSPGTYEPGQVQNSQDIAMNRMSTASSILVNPHESVAFGSGSVNMTRQASTFDSLPGTPTTVLPAQGLESFLRDPETKGEGGHDHSISAKRESDVIDVYGGF
ncbi:hypothetical protein L218DRAFT_949066 [Marasmius fiardii PR-910]|nr:hypothetical protein L218DRAFT_949066 [Marasmius fiardii PR-910]